jgi:hypothetical protein
MTGDPRVQVADASPEILLNLGHEARMPTTCGFGCAPQGLEPEPAD